MRWLPLLALALPTSTVAQAKTLTARWSFRPDFTVAAERILDVDGDGKDELILIGRQGQVRTWHADGLRGTLTLQDAGRCLVAIAPLEPGQPAHLIGATPRGVHAYRFTDGVFQADGVRILGRERFTMRTGQPQLSRYAQDVNGDGRADFVLPGVRECTLYLNQPGGEPYRFTRAGTIEVKVRTGAQMGSAALSSSMATTITVPDLRTYDVNGDDRRDLVAEEHGRRGFHLQREDGSFPKKPDVELDLGAFRDTTPKATVELGRTLALDDATVRTRDLSDDGIPDYVILHRRKVWVYHGTKAGPQFTKPANILKTAEDLSLALLVQLDDDTRPDLMLVRLQLPSIATILAGLLMSWNIDVEVIGYQNIGGEKTFATRPKWRRTVRLQAPAILDLLVKTESFVERFRDVRKKFRYAVEADLDGDGKPDVIIQSEDQKQISAYLGTDGLQAPTGSTERQIRKYAFEDENPVWDIDRLLLLMNEQANSREARLTKGVAPATTFELRDPDVYKIDFAGAADLDGDGRQELVLRYLTVASPATSTFDVLSLAK